MRGFWAVVSGLALVAYPALVYVGLTRWSARAVGLSMLAVLGVRGLVALRKRAGEHLGHVLQGPLAAGALVLAGTLADDRRFMLVIPVGISLVFLWSFGRSLRGPMPIVERYARMQRPDLPAEHVPWCRAVTVVWCGYFVFNALVTLALALAAPLSWWTVYTGAVSYALMGVLFAGELVLRRRRFGSS